MTNYCPYYQTLDSADEGIPLKLPSSPTDTFSMDYRSSTLRILLVEDNPVDRELIRRGLRGISTSSAVDLHCAADWAEAVPMIDASNFDLILLDYHLPPLNGLEILGQLSGHAHPPVIMLTGQNNIVTAVETLRAGAADYVQKTADLGPSLCLTIDRVMAKVALENELAESRTRLAAHAAELEQKVLSRTAVIRAQAAEIEALYLKAEDTSRLKAEIAADVYYELRAPLDAILGCAQRAGALSSGDGVRDEWRTLLQQVGEQAEQISRWIEALPLSWLSAGTEPISPSRFDLSEIVDDLRAQVEASVTGREEGVDCHFEPATGHVEHDRDKVRAVAYHLVNAALKVLPVGRMSVSIGQTPAGGIRLLMTGSVAGTSPEVRALVFDGFRELDGSNGSSYEGLGLGLGIVKSYTRLLSGKIHLEGDPGCGPTVVIDLPPVTPWATGEKFATAS